MTGLCLPNSDIDFVIRFPKKKKDATKNKKGESKPDAINLDESEKKTKEEDGGQEEGEDLEDLISNPLHKLAEAVREEFGIRSELDTMDLAVDDEVDDASEHLSYLEVIEQTRVPLVKFTVAPYNLDIDVCFDQPGGPESAELMHRFMESMPPLRPLTFILKYFLASRDMNKPYTGGIGSYLLQIMIVSFLQQRSREDLHSKGTAGGNYYNLGSLLLDFFELYGMDFNYVTTGISVRNDGFYFAKGEREKKSIFWQPNRPFSLAVENPLETTMDVGAGAFRMNMIQRIFEHAFKTFMAYVAEPREHTDSILATIIPPTEEMVKRMALKVEDSVEEDVGSKSSANNGDGNNQNNISRKKHKADRRDSGGSRGSKKGKNKKRSSK